jgi:hypothetical protein
VSIETSHTVGAETGQATIVGVIQPLLTLVRRQLGRSALDSMLREAGIPPDGLRNHYALVPLSNVARLNVLAIERTCDARIVRRAGTLLLEDPSYLRSYLVIAKTIGLSGLLHAMRFLAMANITPGTTWHIDELGRNHASVTFRTEPATDHPTFCENRIGLLAGLPKLSDLPLATVEHETCIHKGAPCCVYRLRWEGRTGPKWYLLPFFVLFVAVAALMLALGQTGVVPIVAPAVATGLAVLDHVLQRKAVRQTQTVMQSYIETFKEEQANHLKKADALEAVRLLEEALRLAEDENDLIRTTLSVLCQQLHVARACLLLHHDGVLSPAGAEGLAPRDLAELDGFTIPLGRRDGDARLFTPLFRSGGAIRVRIDESFLEQVLESSATLLRKLEIREFVAAPLLGRSGPLGC